MENKKLEYGGIISWATSASIYIPQKHDPFHYALLWKDRPESIIEELSTE